MIQRGCNDDQLLPLAALARERGLELRPWLAEGLPEERLRRMIAGLWHRRADRWSEDRMAAWPRGDRGAHAEMAYLGG